MLGHRPVLPETPSSPPSCSQAQESSFPAVCPPPVWIQSPLKGHHVIILSRSASQTLPKGRLLTNSRGEEGAPWDPLVAAPLTRSDQGGAVSRSAAASQLPTDVFIALLEQSGAQAPTC